MKTIDSLLPQIYQEIKQATVRIVPRDKRIIISLHKQLQTGMFLTENQGNLLKKILKENLLEIVSVVPDIEDTLNLNIWSSSFRRVKKIKKISLSPASHNTFFIEFNFNSRYREKINQLSSKVKGISTLSPTKFVFSLTESNIYHVISSFIGENFEIDEKLMNYFEEIKKIKETSNSPFEIFSISDEKFKKVVESHVGAIDSTNLLTLQDRKIRYQYEICQEIDEKTLTTKIASRKHRNVFINSSEILFSEVIDSLKSLNRLPALLIFDGHKADFDKKTLELVKEAIDTHNLGSEVGIYFRYDKTTDTCQFNQRVSSLGYNKELGKNTIIAGISNNKLPKFMVKMGWKPQTVVSFTNNFKSNKTSVYCTDVDLIVYYTSSKPFGEKFDVLM